MRKIHLLFLTLILIIGLFFRTYKIVEHFEFSHDADLYSWIVKDIVVNHHFRLIGQLTSAPGIFIGPFFYYMLIPFFILTKMDPIGALIPITAIGLLTILSYFFVFSKLFNREVGLFGAFLYAVLVSTVSSDRWVVPTVTTSLWSIWYLYTLLQIARGRFSSPLILGILIGLIWHVHIALIPTLIAIPVAIFTSKKMPNYKQVLNFIIALVATSLPLIIFELRHHFGQTASLINNFATPGVGVTGFYKFQLVLGMVVKNTNTLFFAPESFSLTNNLLFILAILLIPLLLIKKRLISLKELIPLYAWVIGVILFFSISSSPISEYYFASINTIFLAVISLLLFVLFKSSRFGKLILFLILGTILLKNFYFTVTGSYYNKGYLEKKAVVKYILDDAKIKNFPCVGISYITSPGENVGFRYFFYLSNLHLVHPSLDIPVYNIVIPDELSKEVKQKFGHIGLIPPASIPSKEIINKSCRIPNTNLVDPVLGYVE